MQPPVYLKQHQLKQHQRPQRLVQRLTLIGVLALCSACSDPAGTAPRAALPAAAPLVTTSGATAVQAPLPTPTAPSAQPAPRNLPMSVQGVASAGVTVRVKGIELGADATVLKVSISFASRSLHATNMALLDTFLEDDKGNRLMLRRLEQNRHLSVRNGDTLEGDLVFLGSVAPSTTQLKLIFNDTNQADNPVGPGLLMTLPLPARS
jgi:hypothetical protein